MAAPGEVVRAVSEDPWLLQHGLVLAVGALFALAGVVGRMTLKAHAKELDGIAGRLDTHDDKFQIIEERANVIERDCVRSDRIDVLVQRMYEKIDANHNAIMKVLLERRQNYRDSD